MHYTTTLLTLSLLVSLASVVQSAPLKDDEGLYSKRLSNNALSTRYITPATLEPRHIASRHFDALFPRGGTSPPNPSKRKASQISSETSAGGTHNAGAASNEPAAKQRKTSRIKKLPAGKKPKLVCRVPKGKVGNPIIIDAQTSKQLHPLPHAAKAGKGKGASAGGSGAAGAANEAAHAHGNAAAPAVGLKKTRTGLHRRMEYAEGEEQEAPAFVPVQARVPTAKDRGSRVPALGRVLGTGEFAKVYTHRTNSHKVIKVIGEGHGGAGMSTARRKEVAESDVSGLIMAGHFLSDDEWGKFKRGRDTFYYVTSTRISGVMIEAWRPYIQAEAQGEEQRLAVVHAVLEKVKERAYYYYYLQRRTIHADPNPGNVLITGNSVQDLQVDFVDWFEAYSCETTEEELYSNLDIYWDAMLESTEMMMG